MPNQVCGGCVGHVFWRIIIRRIKPKVQHFDFFVNLPDRQPLRSATTNRLAVSPVKLTTVANQPGFPGCRSTDMERPATRRESAESLSIFRQFLKTRLFTKSFPEHRFHP